MEEIRELLKVTTMITLVKLVNNNDPLAMALREKYEEPISIVEQVAYAELN